MTHTLIVYGKRTRTSYKVDLIFSGISFNLYYHPYTKTITEFLADGILFEDDEATISLSVGDKIKIKNIENEIEVIKVNKDLSNGVIEAHTNYTIHNFEDRESKRKSEEHVKIIKTLKSDKEILNYVFKIKQ